MQFNKINRILFIILALSLLLHNPLLSQNKTENLSQDYREVIKKQLTEQYQHRFSEQKINFLITEYIKRDSLYFLNSKNEQNKNITSSPAATAVNAQDSLALIALYNSTDGDNWTDNTNWLSDTAVVYWYGVTVNSGYVTNLNLSNNNLKGTIPAEIGDLTNLEILRLDYNNLTGSMPTELTNPVYLKTIRLNNNQITGTFPTDDGDLSNLEYLDLSFNQLADSIPSGFKDLINLEYLYLNDNLLFGYIPHSMGEMDSLKYLWLNNNLLTDSIPKSLGSLDSLKYLWLHDNHLSGSIPDSLKNLINLQSLSLSSNQLTDSIPSALTSLINLKDELSDFRWNALYTENSTLRTLLNNTQWGDDWESTQTTAPENITSSSATDTSITLTWTPISYTDHGGGYRIYRSTSPGGPYTECGMTADKTLNSFKVNNLAPDITYYFVIRTQTDPHSNNQNTVVSNPSNEISATTTPSLYPEINILGNNTSIQDGDNTPDTSDNTDFGRIAVDDEQTTHTFTIVNNGIIDLNLTGTPKVVLSGPDASDFTIISQPSSPIAPKGGTTTFTVQFDPSGTGIHNATVSIDNNDSDENPYTFSIQGFGDWPEIDVKGNNMSIADGASSPQSADSTEFGYVAIAGETVSHTFTIENTGNANLVLTGNPKVYIFNPVFTVTSQPSSPVAPGETTAFTVKFNPDTTTIGSTSASVIIENNDLNEDPYTFTIHGTATTPIIQIQGNNMNITNGDDDPSPVDGTEFGITPVAEGTIYHTFTIQNIGNADLLLNGTPKVVLTEGTDFQIITQPESPVPGGGGSTTFTVQFDPSVSGTLTETVVVANNDPINSYYFFTIQGTGAVPEMDVQGNSTSISNGDNTPHPADNTDFGSLTVNSDTAFHTFTIKNSGYADLILTGSPNVKINGTHPSDFTVISQPDSLVTAEGDTATFTVRFIPTDIGIRTANISIANTDMEENPYEFSIQGTGITPEINVLGNDIAIIDNDDSPNSADGTEFGNVAVTGDPVPHTFTIVNSGNAALYLTGTPIVAITGMHQSDFTVTSQPSSVISPGGGTTTFTVEFDPSDYTTRTAAINIANTDINEDPYNFNIQGTGVSYEPEIIVKGNDKIIPDNDFSPDETYSDGTYYGYVSVATGTISHTFTIVNQGGADLNLTGTPLIEISGTHNSDFTVTSQPASTIASNGGTTEFTVQFNPNEIGHRNAIVSIANDDIDKNPYEFAIMGTGIYIVAPQDSLALIALYESTNGDEWKRNDNWKNRPVRDWYGVKVNFGVVTGLHLFNNNLTGTIPSEIENLSNIRKLDLQLNKLTGPIPEEIGNLSNLDTLYLNNNQLNDTIPEELGDLTNIQYLYLNNNQLIGPIPPELGNLSNLIKLDLHNNNLEGSIPPELGNLSNLKYLWLNNNQLSGLIPSQLGNLSNLDCIFLNSNLLKGSIPSAVTNLTALIDDLSDFRWNGLYTENNTVLDFLNDKQRGNDWESTQTIAPENFHCAAVTDSSITLNWSLIPYTNNEGGYKVLYSETSGGPYTEYSMTEDKTITSLMVSDLTPKNIYHFTIQSQTDPHPNNKNVFISDPSSEISCTTLESQDSLALVALYNNTDGDNWTNNSNWLSEPIENWYGITVRNGYVRDIDLSDNNLKGTIPSGLENMFKLEKLILNSNQLTGAIPSSLINLTNLTNGSSDFRWNGLYSEDDKLRTFINNKQKGNNWESTQTIPPEDISCRSETATSVKLSWSPINFTLGTGGYRVYYSTVSEGSYTDFGMTEDKTKDSMIVTGLNSETRYYFIIKTQTNPHTNNNFTVVSDNSKEKSSETLEPASIDSEINGKVPKEFALKQNHPNPFNPETEITFDLPKSSQVTLTIYNMLGQPIRTLINNKMPAGSHKVIWHGLNDTGQPMPSGIYIFIMESGSFQQIKKALLMR